MKHTLLFCLLLLVTCTTVTAQLGNQGEKELLAFYQEPAQASIKVYPNPATNFIGLSSTQGIAQLAIYNVVGRKIKTFVVEDDQKYNIGDLPNGMYLVQLIGSNNKVIKTHRLNKR
ncbi:MAG: T9SS type A sorting domain-containing protein [Bacteroidota bacterium]